MLLKIFAKINFGKFPYDVVECGCIVKLHAARCYRWDNTLEREKDALLHCVLTIQL